MNSRFQSYAILWASFGATLALVPGPKEKQTKREKQKTKYQESTQKRDLF